MKPRFGSSFWSPEGTPVSSPESCLLEATCVPCQVSNSRPLPHPLHLFKLTNHLIFCAYVCSVPMSAQVQVHTGGRAGAWKLGNIRHSLPLFIVKTGFLTGLEFASRLGCLAREPEVSTSLPPKRCTGICHCDQEFLFLIGIIGIMSLCLFGKYLSDRAIFCLP